MVEYQIIHIIFMACGAHSKIQKYSATIRSLICFCTCVGFFFFWNLDRTPVQINKMSNDSGLRGVQRKRRSLQRE